MDTKLIIELVGYLGSALVVISMLMTSVVKLRVVNTVGSAIFMGYALVIGSYPTALMNLFLIGINVYQLIRLFKDQKQYDLIETGLNDGYVRYFLDRQSADIREWFPGFSAQGLEDATVWLVCCIHQPASLFIGRQTGPDTMDILLDYAAPIYRDTSAGRYLYNRLKQKGFRTLTFKGSAPGHVAYMEKTGFRKDRTGAYVLNLEEACRD